MSNQLINVNLCGYLPRFGSGWREVEVLRETKKYVELRYAPRSCNTDHHPLTVRRGKLPMDVWERLPKKTKERTMTYVIQYTDPTQPTVQPDTVTKKLPEGASAFTVEVEEDLKRLPTTTLVALYNAAYPNAPVAKFESKAVGARRVFPTLKAIYTPILEQDITFSEEKKRKKNRRYNDDAVIMVLVEKNPKKVGSASYERFALYQPEMTVAAFLAAGGTRQDISWDVTHSFIRIQG